MLLSSLLATFLLANIMIRKVVPQTEVGGRLRISLSAPLPDRDSEVILTSERLEFTGKSESESPTGVPDSDSPLAPRLGDRRLGAAPPGAGRRESGRLSLSFGQMALLPHSLRWRFSSRGTQCCAQQCSPNCKDQKRINRYYLWNFSCPPVGFEGGSKVKV